MLGIRTGIGFGWQFAGKHCRTSTAISAHPCPKNFYKNYMSAKIGAVGLGLFLAI